MSKQQALHEQIAEKLIKALEDGTSPFQKPWTDDHTAGYITPMNPTTGKNYRGMNALWLAMQEREDPRWMTLKQASFNKWTVEKGSKATLINFVKTTDLVPVTDAKGEKVTGENGKPKMQTVKLDKPIITTAWVFNGEQIKGIPEWKAAYTEKQAEQKWSPVERAEQIFSASQAKLKHGGNDAFYNKTKDYIQLPKKEQFDSAAKYYATLLHEVGHWTGHKDRLNRPMEGKFGSEAYAREELRAEISSLMMGSELNIGHDFGQHAAYVESWVKILKEEPFELHKAAADAQKIVDYMLDLEQKRDLKQEVTEKPAVAVLNKGDQIPYKNTEYKVEAILKGRVAQMQDLSNGNRFKLSPKDGLYTSLIEAKKNPLGRTTEHQLQQKEQPQERQQEQVQPVAAMALPEEKPTYQRKR
jgi:antirestriction protein ArdC